MRISLRDRLVYASATVRHRGRELFLPNMMIDTGSWGTAIATDVAASAGVVQELEDDVGLVHGISGDESVVSKRIDSLEVDGVTVHNIEIELAPLDYGFPMDGILGLEYLASVGAVLDLSDLLLRVHGAATPE